MRYWISHTKCELKYNYVWNHVESFFFLTFFQGFGRPDHAITVDILKKVYPEYKSITFTNDGY